ncbi:HlyD family secretion protein [Maribacter aurantiacus]|uniref:HlyD family efflux transporter periplasmic adaptor subunit n=1 Tax=Maribacter aurantiacus TaxID=1882343 RepID=A0A5R8M4C0_9FLAO|nr:HlyD family efflux transporter periplasmic adaptor subunit [Maribacter aurantiacus]TLF44472.1 HlyD family efflux transporter periplasmic adaptor subunit [Maribacter aurantiacus]
MVKKSRNLELRSEEIKDILTQPPSLLIRTGNGIFLFTLLLLFSLSWIFKYPDIIATEALITTDIPPQTEFAKYSGSFDTIFVNNFQAVNKNQILAILENSADTQDVLFIKKILENYEIKPELDISIKLPNLLLLGELETSYTAFKENYLIYELNYTLNPQLNKSQANKISTNELRARLSNLESQKDLGISEMEISTNNFERMKLLYQKGVLSKSEFEKQELEIIRVENKLKSLINTISSTREALGLALNNASELFINKIETKQKLYNNLVQSYTRLRKEIRDWENNYVFKSKIDGTVAFNGFWDKNQTVKQGELIFTVIPKTSLSYISKLKTPAKNFGKIKIGQKVNIGLDSYPQNEFGVLEGIISNVSLVPDEQNNYWIDVNLEDKLVTSYGKEIKFNQNMTGSAEIITEDLRLAHRFLNRLKGLYKQ